MRRTRITTIAFLAFGALYAGCDQTPPSARYVVLSGDLARMSFIPARDVSESMASVTNWVCLTPILAGQLALLLDGQTNVTDKGMALQVADDATWVDAMLACEKATELARGHGAIADDEVIRMPRVEEYMLLVKQRSGELALRNLGVLPDADRTICREWTYGVATDAKTDVAPIVRIDPLGEAVRITVQTNRCLNGQGSTFRLMISREQDIAVSNKFAALRTRLLLGTANERRLRYGAVLTVFGYGKSAPTAEEGETVPPPRPLQ